MDIAKTDDLNPEYKKLLERISRRYVEGQAQAIRSVNESLIDTSWNYLVKRERRTFGRICYLWNK
jgi:hypothetical protein